FDLIMRTTSAVRASFSLIALVSVSFSVCSSAIVPPRTAGPSPATSCGSHYVERLASDGGAPAPRRPVARTTLNGSPRTAGPSPAASCGSHYVERLASDGGAPAPRRPAARTTCLLYAQPGVEHVTKTVAEEVQAQPGDGQGETGEEAH